MSNDKNLVSVSAIIEGKEEIPTSGVFVGIISGMTLQIPSRHPPRSQVWLGDTVRNGITKPC